MEYDRPGDQLGRGQPTEGQVERVKDPGLWVGQEGNPQKEVGVPQGDPPAADGLGGVGAVRVEVGGGVRPGEDEVGERDLPVKAQAQRTQQDYGS